MACRHTQKRFFPQILPMHKKLFALIVSLLLVSALTGCATRLQRGPLTGDKPPTQSKWGNAMSFNMEPAEGNILGQPAIFAGDIARIHNRTTKWRMAIRGNRSDKVRYLGPGESTSVDLSLTNYSLTFYVEINGELQLLWPQSFDRSGARAERYYYDYAITYYDGPSYEPVLDRFGRRVDVSLH